MVELNEDLVRELYLKQGLSMRKISQKIGVNLATLSRFMARHGIKARDKAQAQKNYLKDNKHPMQGVKHSEDTRRRISSSLGQFWDGLTDAQREAFKKKIGAAWRRKWAAMDEQARKIMIEELTAKAKARQGKGSRLEHFIAEELRKRGYTVEERTTNYTMGKQFEVDLALPKEMIAIEVDGPTHFLNIYGEEALAKQQERDARKDELINSAGYNVLRIRDNNNALSQLRINSIEKAIKDIMTSGEITVWYLEE